MRGSAPPFLNTPGNEPLLEVRIGSKSKSVLGMAHENSACIALHNYILQDDSTITWHDENKKIDSLFGLDLFINVPKYLGCFKVTHYVDTFDQTFRY